MRSVATLNNNVEPASGDEPETPKLAVRAIRARR